MDMLESCEVLDNSFTDIDPGLPPVPSAKFESSMFYSKKTMSRDTKTPRPRAPVFRRCKNPELWNKIVQSCASLLSNSFSKEPSSETENEDVVPETDENVATDENVPPIDDAEDGEENSCYHYEATEESDHSCQDMELDDIDEDTLPICQQTVAPSDTSRDDDEMELEDKENEVVNETDQYPAGACGYGYARAKQDRMPLGDVTVSESENCFSLVVLSARQT
jgi:hypothetical protein